MEKGIGLVLSGGGGKGAYEIGVIKALDKLDITRSITCVSGSSVGAYYNLEGVQSNEYKWKVLFL